MTRSLIALAAFAFVQQTAAPPPLPDDLFARAVAVIREDAKPPYATYTVVVTVTNDGHHVINSWQTTEDITHRIVLASSFSDEERSNPTTPQGINVVAHRRFVLSAPRSFSAGLDPTENLSINSSPFNPVETGDAVGPVALAVDQDFGLTPPRAYQVATDDRTVAAAADELAVIGATGAIMPRYRVTLVGTDAGIAHLELTPLRDSYHNRLRELWVDTQTAYIQAAVVQGVGDRPPFDRALWHVTFDRAEGATYVSEVDSAEPLSIRGSSPHVNIAFQKLSLLPHSPIQTTFGIEAPLHYLRDP